MALSENLQTLLKALEAGQVDAAPSTLLQGAALQIEDLSPVMEVTTFKDEHIKLQKELNVVSTKSVLAQFDRQLSYGQFGGSAQFEGAVGQEETSDYARIVVPMCFYSHIRKVTVVANMVQTVDGKKAEDRAAADAAKKIAGDMEFDLFRGKGDFSNQGVFDGNPLVIPTLPNIQGVEAQVRMSDNQRNAKDLMFSEYGSDDSIVIPGGSTLTQSMIEDASVRSAMNMGSADKLLVDPKVLSAYNKIALGKERIVLAGSPQDATGADLRRQWVSGGVVNIEASRFLSGKTGPARSRPTGPAIPTVSGSAGNVSSSTAFTAGQIYTYFVTAVNEIGESPATAGTAVTIVADTNGASLTISNQAGVRYYNVYRTPAGGSAASAKFTGRVMAKASGNTTFFDLGGKTPGFVTGYLIENDTMDIRELAGYSRLKLAVTDLSVPEAHFRFATLAVTAPRKNVLIDSLTG
jgi:hypothetical protein